MSYTIGIRLWDDGTDSVECRYGDSDGVIHTSVFYDGELSYQRTVAMPEGVFMINDAIGGEKYVYPAMLTEEELQEYIKDGKEIPMELSEG